MSRNISALLLTVSEFLNKENPRCVDYDKTFENQKHCDDRDVSKYS